jgi:hypothetical protein
MVYQLAHLLGVAGAQYDLHYMTDEAACKDRLAELGLRPYGTSRGVRAVRHRDVSRSQRETDSLPGTALSELCGARGATKQFNPWARSDQARPLTLVSSSWRESRP